MGSKWVPILTPPEYGESPYDWTSRYAGECTWGAYYRVRKNGWPDPCWYDHQTNTPGYTIAKDWMEEVRSPWVPFSVDNYPDYIPVPGDILVFDGNYGHVAVIEETVVQNEVYIISDWNRVAPHVYDCTQWQKGTTLTRTGKLKGYLHYDPSNEKYVTPVDRNPSVNQLQATDGTLRVRLKPNLNGDIYCMITPGYYNVKSSVAATKEDKVKVDGLTTWYEIEDGKWCANITTKYLPVDGPTDISKLLEELENAIVSLQEENNDYKTRTDKAIKVLSGEDI